MMIQKNVLDTIYPDVKGAISEIAKGLGIAVEYTWTIIVKQYVVKGVTELLIFVLGLSIGIIGVVLLTKYIKNNEKITWKIIPSITLLIISIIAICNVNFHMMLQGLINPEFGAMSYILDFVKTL